MRRFRWLGVLVALLASTAAWAEIQPMTNAEKKKISNLLQAYFKVRDPQRRDDALVKKAEQAVRDLDARRARTKKSSVLADVDGLSDAIRGSRSFDSPRSRGLKSVSWDDSPFPGGKASFQLNIPAKYRPAIPTPVILALHPKDMEAANYVSRAFLKNRAFRDGFLIVAPEWPERKEATWGTEKSERCGELLVPLAYVIQNFHVDMDRIYVVGTAEGATAAFDIAMNFTDLFAGVFTIGEPAERAIKSNLEHLTVHQLAQNGDLPHVASHDEVLAKVGTDDAVLTRNLFPTKIDWRFDAPIQQRAYWVLITRHRPLPEGEVGQITAEIVDNNAIEITAKGVDGFTLFLNDRLVDLEEPVSVTINGVEQEAWTATRSLSSAIEWMMLTGDIGRTFTVEREFAVPLEKNGDGDKDDGEGEPEDGGNGD